MAKGRVPRILIADPNKPTRNSMLVESFIDYCIEHPEERFWQALRNWAEVRTVYTTQPPLNTLLDTFHWEGRNG